MRQAAQLWCHKSTSKRRGWSTHAALALESPARRRHVARVLALLETKGKRKRAPETNGRGGGISLTHREREEEEFDASCRDAGKCHGQSFGVVGQGRTRLRGEMSGMPISRGARILPAQRADSSAHTRGQRRWSLKNRSPPRAVRSAVTFYATRRAAVLGRACSPAARSERSPSKRQASS